MEVRSSPQQERQCASPRQLANPGGGVPQESQNSNIVQGNSMTVWEIVTLLFSFFFGGAVIFNVFVIIICEVEDNSVASHAYCRNYYFQFSTSKNSYIHAWYFWVIAAVIYIGYIVEAVWNPVSRYTLHLYESRSSCREYMDKIRSTKPSYWFSIQNFHYEQRTRTVTTTDKNGHRQTHIEHYTVRVDTSYFKDFFHFDEWDDISAIFEMPKKKRMLRIRLHKDLHFGDTETQTMYDEAYSNFIKTHITDSHHDDNKGMEMTMYHYLLGFRTPEDKPMWMNVPLYWFFTIIGLSVVFRIMLLCTTDPLDYTVSKRVYATHGGLCQQRRKYTEPEISYDNVVPGSIVFDEEDEEEVQDFEPSAQQHPQQGRRALPDADPEGHSNEPFEMTRDYTTTFLPGAAERLPEGTTWFRDKSTGLYYSPSTGLHYNVETHQYYSASADMWYDNETKEWYKKHASAHGNALPPQPTEQRQVTERSEEGNFI